MPDLNTDKNVYLLGAGFSKEAGLPLQGDFLMVAKEVYFKNPKLYEHFENVFKYQDELTKMKKYLNYPLLNLEHLFNLIEMDVFYSDNTEKENIKNDFIKLISDVLIEKTANPFTHTKDGRLIIENRYQKYLSFINLLFNRHNNLMYCDTIISFNYDLIVEGAASIYNYGQDKTLPSIGEKHNNFIKFNTIFGKENISIDPISE
ncbi:MAG TPA: hypothetical protein VIN67_03520 [Desulfobaccales bacterium]